MQERPLAENDASVKQHEGAKLTIITQSSAVARGVRADYPLRDRMRRFLSKPHFLGLADQAIVSATSFFTLVIFARTTNAEETGYFALAISIAATGIAIQHALISQPYMIGSEHDGTSREERASCGLMLSAMMSATLVVLFLAAASAFAAVGGSAAAVATTLALVGFVPAVLAKELLRNFGLAHLNLRRALMIDSAACTLQLAALAYLAASGKITLVAALTAIGAMSLLISAISLYATRGEFSSTRVPMRHLLAQSWATGKWFTVSRIAHLAQGYATLWLTAAIDMKMTAVFAACLSIVGLANPIVQGLYNILAPQAVLAWRNEGAEGLRRKALQDLALLAVVMAALSIVIMLVAESLVQLLYPAPEFGGYGNVTYVLAFAASAAALGIPASNGLATSGEARTAARITVACAILHGILVWLAMSQYGLLGAAFATLASSIIWTTARWTAFLSLNKIGRCALHG